MPGYIRRCPEGSSARIAASISGPVTAVRSTGYERASSGQDLWSQWRGGLRIFVGLDAGRRLRRGGRGHGRGDHRLHEAPEPVSDANDRALVERLGETPSFPGHLLRHRIEVVR